MHALIRPTTTSTPTTTAAAAVFRGTRASRSRTRTPSPLPLPMPLARSIHGSSSPVHTARSTSLPPPATRRQRQPSSFLLAPCSAATVTVTASTGSTHCFSTHSQPLRHLSATAVPGISPGPPGPLEAYRTLVRAGKVRMDAHQLEIVRRLQALYDDVLLHCPPNAAAPATSVGATGHKSGALWNKFLGIFGKDDKRAGQGDDEDVNPQSVKRAAVPSLYLHGTPGTGKTFTMDLFANALPAHIPKQRVHFNQFMINVHARSHQLKSASSTPIDPLPLIAAELATSSRVLCFDEFQVTNISDAMILRRLLTLLWNHGIVLIMTSNRHPSELYQNGLQRESFLPCIDLITHMCNVVSLNSGVDYRQRVQGTADVYFSPLGDESGRLIERVWRELTRGAEVSPKDLPHTGRFVHVPQQVAASPALASGHTNASGAPSTTGVARFTFDDLCNQPLAAADYLAIVHTYPTILITHIPVLSVTDSRAELRRWITFVDAAYEQKCNLVLHLARPVHELVLPPAPGENPNDEERFAVDRTTSRLVEMQGDEWEAPHVKLVREAVRRARAKAGVEEVVRGAKAVGGRVARGELAGEVEEA
ncbi:AFG1-like ATPase-domain-containing protein [Catenaria anguillulae PL171]|uniref:AFG1-like ATPase-domain-containing protein n=1 Tax=Catenaria anguillulae PL171 TaxID=765915 RepID=A0A1Y2HL48_9FUNG|nr:AFG1-like ATPase-domain-containing protein [Catenaria anguillulae PL171]